MTMLIVVSLTCLAWGYLIFARGDFWRAAERDDVPALSNTSLTDWPRIVAVIPARDEAGVIGASVGSLLAQHYRGEFSVIVVDDDSADDTRPIAERVAAAHPRGRLTVLTAPPLPAGWSGKLWALEHGIRHAEAQSKPPEYLFLTDADIVHATDGVESLAIRAQADGLALNSLMAKLRCVTFAERFSIPSFVFFFQMLYPFAWVNDPRRRTAAAAGGCMLVERRALRAAGGLDAIHGALIDDCALARLLKPHGRIRLALTERVRSIRAYPSFADIRRMIVRCAFTQLNCSVALLVGTIAGMLVVFVAPLIVALFGDGPSRRLALLAWACMAIAYRPTLRLYSLSPAWGIALPLIAGWYAWLTLDSALQHLRGRGGQWKGRVQVRSGAATPAAATAPTRRHATVRAAESAPMSDRSSHPDA
ncbi:MAG TPA: glycosyltransferase [Casimicrobiaceae bacterium]|nr:glycosyltransferase [Casimicrobiaceae bacterium]